MSYEMLFCHCIGKILPYSWQATAMRLASRCHTVGKTLPIVRQKGNSITFDVQTADGEEYWQTTSF